MFWTRKQLKEKAKFSMHRNYWRCVLAALIISLAAGLGSTSSITEKLVGEDDSDTYTGDYAGNGFEDGFEDDFYGYGYGYDDGFTIPYEMEEELTADSARDVVVIALIVILAAAVGIVIGIFVLNPLEVGARRFFFHNLNAEAQAKEIAFPYDSNYKNITRIMFFKDLYTVLWTLLFIIPGIVKSYEYSMIPYLLNENPNMSKEEAFVRSRQMMYGQKWSAFKLDLSFLLWDILSALTLGIVGVFYVQPYRLQTHAALFEALRFGRPDNSFQDGFTQNDGFSRN